MVAAICQFTFCRNTIYPFHPAYHITVHLSFIRLGAFSKDVHTEKQYIFFHGFSVQAFSNSFISSFTIVIIACMARFAFSLFSPCSNCSIIVGVTCHATPYLSRSQPHCTSLPSSVSLFQ